LFNDAWAICQLYNGDNKLKFYRRDDDFRFILDHYSATTEPTVRL